MCLKNSILIDFYYLLISTFLLTQALGISKVDSHSRYALLQNKVIRPKPLHAPKKRCLAGHLRQKLNFRKRHRKYSNILKAADVEVQLCTGQNPRVHSFLFYARLINDCEPTPIPQASATSWVNHKIYFLC